MTKEELALEIIERLKKEYPDAAFPITMPTVDLAENINIRRC